MRPIFTILLITAILGGPAVVGKLLLRTLGKVYDFLLPRKPDPVPRPDWDTIRNMARTVNQRKPDDYILIKDGAGYSLCYVVGEFHDNLNDFVHLRDVREPPGHDGVPFKAEDLLAVGATIVAPNEKIVEHYLPYGRMPLRSIGRSVEHPDLDPVA